MVSFRFCIVATNFYGFSDEIGKTHTLLLGIVPRGERAKRKHRPLQLFVYESFLGYD